MTTFSASETRSQRAPRSLASVLGSPWFFWITLTLYLAAHFALRLWETPNIGKNDVQEAISAQAWAWGYHPRNPPLHTWMQMASYWLLGTRQIAHIALHYVLLAATYGFAWLAARRLIADRALATLAALSLMLVSPFAFTVFTAWTHTLLLAALNLATLWIALRLTEHKRLTDYLLLGVVIGLGFLAKYSYALFLGPLLMAMLTQRALRSALLSPRLLITLVVAGVVLAPHAIWMETARFNFVQFLAEKQRSEVAQPYLKDLASGLGNVAVGALTFLLPLALFFPIFFRNGFKAAAKPADAWGRATALVMAFGMALLVLDVVVLRATQFEARYFTCALITAPLVLFQWLDRREHGDHGIRGYLIAGVVAMLIVFGGLAGRAAFYHRSCNRCWDEMPMQNLITAVRADGFSSGTIIAADYNMGGNLRLAFPQARTYAVNYYVPQAPVGSAGQCMLVWNARIVGDEPPEAITTYLDAIHLPLPAQGGPRFVDAPLRRSTTRMDRFAYWILPNADANCRPR